MAHYPNDPHCGIRGTGEASHELASWTVDFDEEAQSRIRLLLDTCGPLLMGNINIQFLGGG